MRLKRAAVAMVCAVVVAIPAMAQEMGRVCEIHVNKVKPGMTQQYETGRKKHMGWHKSQKDGWSWYTWEVLTGDYTGSYVVGTFGHQWKDFDGRDKFNESDSADANASMGASMAGQTMSYYIYRPDLSGGPENPTPAKLISVTHFMLKPDGVNDFIEGVKKVGEGIKKTNYPLSGANHWYQLVSGGTSPHFVLVGDRANWASFQPPTDKTLDAMMAEAYGQEQGAAILSSLRKTFQSVYTESLQYRPDLSYVAGK